MVSLPRLGRNEIQLIGNFQSVRRRLSIAIPKVNRSQLSVQSNGLLPPQIQGSSGTTATIENGDLQGATIASDIGSSEQLQLEWPVSSPALVPAIQVRQLNWLHAEQMSLRMEIQLQCSVLRGPVETIRLECDPELVPLSPTTDTMTVARIDAVRETTDGRRILEVELTDSFQNTDEFSLTLGFSATGRSAVGRIRVPRVVPIGEEVIETWLGVSATSELAASLVDVAEPRSVDPAVFAAAWGGEREPPGLALRSNSPEESTLIELQPLPPETTAEQELWFVAGPDRGEFQLSLRCDTFTGHRWKHQLTIPAASAISSVEIEEIEQPKTLRWSRPTPERLAIFPNEPLEGIYEITVTGTVPLPSRGTVQLPAFTWDSAVSANVVHLYRSPNVLIGPLGEFAQTEHDSLGISGRWSPWQEKNILRVSDGSIGSPSRTVPPGSPGRFIASIDRQQGGSDRFRI